MIVLLLPLVLARAPGMVQAGPGGFERCPGDEVAAWRSQLQSRSSAAVRQALLDGFEEAVVEWAVCAHLQALPRWSTPELQGEVALGLLQSLSRAQGQRARLEAVEAAVEVMPRAAALVALEELSVIELLSQVEPARRLGLLEAAVGSWACPDDRLWVDDADGSQVGLCPSRVDQDYGVEGLERLVELARPSLDSRDSSSPLAIEVASRWSRLEPIEFPLTLQAPVELPVGAGSLVEPGLEAVAVVDGEVLSWWRSPGMRIEPGQILRWGLESLPQGGPGAMDGGTWVYADGTGSVGSLARTLQEAGVLRPRFVAEGSGGLIHLGVALLENSEQVGVKREGLEELLSEASSSGAVVMEVVVDPDLAYLDLVEMAGRAHRDGVGLLVRTGRSE